MGPVRSVGHLVIIETVLAYQPGSAADRARMPISSNFDLKNPPLG